VHLNRSRVVAGSPGPAACRIQFDFPGVADYTLPSTRQLDFEEKRPCVTYSRAASRPFWALLAAGACGPVPEEEPARAGAAPEAHADVPASFKRNASGGVRDTGDFVVQYGETENEDYLELEAVFKETQLLEDTVKELNGEFALPADVPVVLRECGEVNAFYDPEAGEISLCYELVEHYFEIFMADAQTDAEQEEAATSVASATVFTFFHEMGHALIAIYDLPVTGREEDAAIDGANSFVGEDEEEMDDLSFWDEHSLDEQRFYNILCWIYGKDSEGYQYLVDDETLPADRAERCPAEYDRMYRSWEALLAPYVKPGR
jgi:hypothetical protein